MIFLYLGAFLILPLEVAEILQLLLIVLFTLTGCFITYELVIRRIRFLRPLFGLKQPSIHAKTRVAPNLKLLHNKTLLS
jgi:hypothetical protein